MPKTTDTTDEILQYFVVNTTLNMSPGKLAAQAAHAATISAIDGLSSSGQKRAWFDSWVRGEMKKIVLAGTQEDLARLAREGGHLVIDAGYTEVPPQSPTVVALPPMPRSVAGPLVNGLNLLRQPGIKPPSI